MIIFICPITIGPLKGRDYVWKLLQFINPSSNLNVNTLKLKLKVYTSIASWLFHFKSIAVVYRAENMEIVSLSKYFRT